MSSIQTIGVRTLKQTLEANSLIAGLVDDRIFWEHADEDEVFPYVVINHISGGEDNDAQSRACSYNWKVAGHTADLRTARLLADEIHTGLHRRMPDTTGIPEALGYTWIEELIPIFDRDNEQNTVFFQAGGIYRLRLSLEQIT